jgi:transketolase
MALAARIQGLSYNVYCLLGDGELHEGQIWEAAMTAAQHRLGNVVAIIDRNGLKAMDEVACAKCLDRLADRWASFGWAVVEIDGHDMAAICDALDWADGQTQQPAMIIATTIKGKGISFIEGNPGYHNAPMNSDDVACAIAELESALNAMEG